MPLNDLIKPLLSAFSNSVIRKCLSLIPKSIHSNPYETAARSACVVSLLQLQRQDVVAGVILTQDLHIRG